MDLINKTAEKSLSGLENLAGIPASIGGAIRGNAGAFGTEISDLVIGVEIMRGGKQFILNKEKCNFAYRESIFKHNNDLIISAEFQLEKKDQVKINDKIKKVLTYRKDHHPLDYASAGCIFKNIQINSENENKVKNLLNVPDEFLTKKEIPAGWIIDQLDLGGKTIGQAQVSEKHCNFIINLGKATANDVIQLISYIKMQARDKLGLQLMEEIVYLGF